MSFLGSGADPSEFKDAVFSLAERARADKKKNGELVTDATVGSLYGEDGKLAAFKTVYDSYDNLNPRVKAAYAAGVAGNPDYRKDVFSWVTQGISVDLPHAVVAGPGGTGAIVLALETALDRGDSLLIPSVGWSNYILMAKERGLTPVKYEMFRGDSFNLEDLKKKALELSEKQERVLIIVNDPCHNPTGYSMTYDEWAGLIRFSNELAKKKPVILLDDIAYIDYSYDLSTCRNYMGLWNNIGPNVMLMAAFSCSKTLTSYGLRCGAAVVMARSEKDVSEVEAAMTRRARATWSNVNNSAMVNFSLLLQNSRDEFLEEKQKYIDLMRERSGLFLSEARKAGLDVYPYRGGFFITLRVIDDAFRKRFHEALIEKHIYTISVGGGIRVAVCSLPLNKVRGLATRMKDIYDELRKKG